MPRFLPLEGVMNKREIIQEAFTEIGLGPYTYDMQPEDFQTGLTRLDAMMAQWATERVDVGYPLGGDLDTQTNLPANAKEAVILGLAMRIAPSYGKNPSALTIQLARNGFMTLQNATAVIPNRLRDMAPAGAGNRNGHSEIFPEETA